jgi:hypothetical protein
MRIIRNTYINRATNPDGTRNVAGYYGPDEGWLPMGKLQPEVTNHIKEQPTNKWRAFLIERGS